MAMWEMFKNSLSDDIQHQALREGREIPKEELFNECLIRIEDITISIAGKMFGTEHDQIPLPRTNREHLNQRNHEIVRETNFSREELLEYCSRRVPMMTDEQRRVFDEVVGAIDRGDPKTYFLDAPGGTGKTFILSLILAKVRSEGNIILACASSGIASTLLDGGRTAHSAFGIPLRHQDIPICSIKRGTHKAELLQRCKAIIWDECTMSKRQDAEAVDRTLKDIRQDQRTFGGLVVLFAGDFRQTLPVIAKSTSADCIAACLKNSYLWNSVHTLNLTTNMRVHMNRDPGAASFSTLLLRMGDGQIPCTDNMEIQINLNLCVPVRTIDALIDAVFPNLNNNIADSEWLRERAILAPLNSDVDELNLQIQDRLGLHHATRTYYSIDRCCDEDQSVNFPVEVLNSLETSNFPKHELKLRVGSPIIMLRNLQPPILCNGTRMKVVQLRQNVITASILSGPGQGSVVLIPRIKLITDEDFIVRFSRRQFPIRLAYAMTINKSQGQTLKVAGLNLFESSCFSHGRLYVACSRIEMRSNLYISTRNNKTRNVVYPQVLN